MEGLWATIVIGEEEEETEQAFGAVAAEEADVTQLPPLHPCPWLQLLPLGLTGWRWAWCRETGPGRASRRV